MIINNPIIYYSFCFMRIAISKFLFSNPKPLSLTFNNQTKAAYLKLTNPKKRNVLSHATIKELHSSLQQIQSSISKKQTKILILEGEGPVFCSGHDLKELADSSNPKEIFDACANLMLRIKNFTVPTLCSINGIAAAAGFQLALACDMIVATEKSSFSTPGIKWGLFCSTPAVQLIRAISSQKKAMEMLMFGQPISAKEAFHYGLINKIVEEDQMEKQISNYVDKALYLSGQVISLGKRVLRQQEKETLENAYCVAGNGMEANIKEKEDCKEGFKAFREKRHPVYKN